MEQKYWMNAKDMPVCVCVDFLKQCKRNKITKQSRLFEIFFIYLWFEISVKMWGVTKIRRRNVFFDDTFDTLNRISSTHHVFYTAFTMSLDSLSIIWRVLSPVVVFLLCLCVCVLKWRFKNDLDILFTFYFENTDDFIHVGHKTRHFSSVISVPPKLMQNIV